MNVRSTSTLLFGVVLIAVLFSPCMLFVSAGSSVVIRYKESKTPNEWKEWIALSTPALFGTEPILKDTMGILIPAGYTGNLADGPNGINPDVAYACQPLNVTDNPKWKAAYAASLNVILLIQRGQCKFEVKVLNGQRANNVGELGGNVVGVLVADLQANMNNQFLDYMNDAGDGVSVKIPSALISYNDSLEAISRVTAANDTYAVMEFFLPTEDGNVEYVLMTSVLDVDKNSVSNGTTFKLTMRDVARQIKTQAILVYVPLLAYISISSSSCAAFPPDFMTKLCLKDENIGAYTGAALVQESVRQFIISQQLLSRNCSYKIYDYWNIFYDMCARDPKKFTSSCSNSALAASDLSLYGVTSDNVTAEYELRAYLYADALMEQYYKYRPVKEPALFINHVAYHGTVGNCQPPLTQLQCDYVQWICAGYYADQQPIGCTTDVDCPFGQTKDWCSVCNGTNDCKSSSGVTLAVLFGIILVALIIVGTTIYLYVQKQQKVTRNEVDTLLRQYLPTDSGLGNALSSSDIKKTQQTRLIHDNASEL